jgi:heme-degrading monooxygenase HmoA
MIIRTWEGRTHLSDGDAYERFMIDRAAPDYSSVDGLQRLYFARRDVGDAAHFLLITCWKSISAVKAFTAGDPCAAKYYPEDRAFLLEQDPAAKNFRLFHSAQSSEQP